MVPARISGVVGLALAFFAIGVFNLPASAAPEYEGYTFCASGSVGYLLDPDGVVVHTWHASGAAQTCAYLLEDGSALFPIQNSSCGSPHHDGAYPHGRFQKINWEDDIVWDYRFCDATARAGYDVEPMPNGNILIPTDARNVAKVFEVQPTGPTSGTIVWQCALPDSLTGSVTYMNSVSYNPTRDEIIVDMQEPQRKVVVIDHSVAGGRVLRTYRIGSYGRVHAAIWVTRYFLGTDIEMPDANLTAMRENNILVVYNGGNAVHEINRLTGARSSISFNYEDHEGSCQRLPNGNTLVSRGQGTTITELNDNGQVVATMAAPGQILRAYRYGPAYPGLSELFPNAVDDVIVTPVSPVRFVYQNGEDRGEVTLARPQASGPLTVSIVGLDGRLLSTVSTPDPTASFSTSDLPSGLYFVRVQYPGAVYHTRFAKVR